MREFTDAKAATTPSTIGTAAEQPVRNQLAQILPRGIAVGEGFVIDSYGGTSRQQDVVLYERDICPVFSMKDTPQATYYPCESVIAVGEIKSSLDVASLEDAFLKVASVKQLRRYVMPFPIPDPPTGDPMPMYWNYLTPHGDEVLRMDEGSEPNDEEKRRIFGFVLAGGSRFKPDTLADTFACLAAQVGDVTSPNLLTVLSGAIVTWGTVGPEERRETVKRDDSIHALSVHGAGPDQ